MSSVEIETSFVDWKSMGFTLVSFPFSEFIDFDYDMYVELNRKSDNLTKRYYILRHLTPSHPQFGTDNTVIVSTQPIYRVFNDVDYIQPNNTYEIRILITYAYTSGVLYFWNTNKNFVLPYEYDNWSNERQIKLFNVSESSIHLGKWYTINNLDPGVQYHFLVHIRNEPQRRGRERLGYKPFSTIPDLQVTDVDYVIEKQDIYFWDPLLFEVQKNRVFILFQINGFTLNIESYNNNTFSIYKNVKTVINGVDVFLSPEKTRFAIINPYGKAYIYMDNLSLNTTYTVILTFQDGDKVINTLEYEFFSGIQKLQVFQYDYTFNYIGFNQVSFTLNDFQLSNVAYNSYLLRIRLELYYISNNTKWSKYTTLYDSVSKDDINFMTQHIIDNLNTNQEYQVRLLFYHKPDENTNLLITEFDLPSIQTDVDFRVTSIGINLTNVYFSTCRFQIRNFTPIRDNDGYKNFPFDFDIMYIEKNNPSNETDVYQITTTTVNDFETMNVYIQNLTPQTEYKIYVRIYYNDGTIVRFPKTFTTLEDNPITYTYLSYDWTNLYELHLEKFVVKSEYTTIPFNIIFEIYQYESSNIFAAVLIDTVRDPAFQNLYANINFRTQIPLLENDFLNYLVFVYSSFPEMNAWYYVDIVYEFVDNTFASRDHFKGGGLYIS